MKHNIERAEIINTLLKQMKGKSYMEIGINKLHWNFTKIHACYKICIEPFPQPDTKHLIDFIGTSDEYFKTISSDVKFDVIFIDGLHVSDQVTRDIHNSLLHLNEGGTIVCHDCLPKTEYEQLSSFHSGPWTGDVWKSIARLRIESDDLDVKVVDTDHGCGIIRRGINIPYKGPEGDPYSYSYYVENRNNLLNVISVKEFYSFVENMK